MSIEISVNVKSPNNENNLVHKLYLKVIDGVRVDPCECFDKIDGAGIMLITGLEVLIED